MHYERGGEMLRVLALLATWVGEDTQQNPFKVFPGEVLGMGEPRECCPWRAEQSRAYPFIPFMDTHPVCSSSSPGVPWAKWELLQQSPSWGGKKKLFQTNEVLKPPRCHQGFLLRGLPCKNEGCQHYPVLFITYRILILPTNLVNSS